MSARKNFESDILNFQIALGNTGAIETIDNEGAASNDAESRPSTVMLESQTAGQPTDPLHFPANIFENPAKCWNDDTFRTWLLADRDMDDADDPASHRCSLLHPDTLLPLDATEQGDLDSQPVHPPPDVLLDFLGDVLGHFAQPEAGPHTPRLLTPGPTRRGRDQVAIVFSSSISRPRARRSCCRVGGRVGGRDFQCRMLGISTGRGRPSRVSRPHPGPRFVDNTLPFPPDPSPPASPSPPPFPPVHPCFATPTAYQAQWAFSLPVPPFLSLHAPRSLSPRSLSVYSPLYLPPPTSLPVPVPSSSSPPSLLSPYLSLPVPSSPVPTLSSLSVLSLSLPSPLPLFLYHSLPVPSSSPPPSSLSPSLSPFPLSIPPLRVPSPLSVPSPPSSSALSPQRESGEGEREKRKRDNYIPLSYLHPPPITIPPPFPPPAPHAGVRLTRACARCSRPGPSHPPRRSPGLAPSRCGGPAPSPASTAPPERPLSTTPARRPAPPSWSPAAPPSSPPHRR